MEEWEVTIRNCAFLQNFLAFFCYTAHITISLFSRISPTRTHRVHSSLQSSVDYLGICFGRWFRVNYARIFLKKWLKEMNEMDEWIKFFVFWFYRKKIIKPPKEWISLWYMVCSGQKVDLSLLCKELYESFQREGNLVGDEEERTSFI